jgi:pantothenate synthetase
MYKSGLSQKEEIFNQALSLLPDGVELEYMDAFNVNNFEVLDILKPGSLIAIAARVGGVRLIDNIIIE